MTELELKRAWRTQPPGARHPTLEETRRAARRVARRVGVRNAAEYVAAAAAALVLVRYLWLFPTPWMRAGSAACLVAVLFLAWQLRRRASALPPSELGAMPWRARHRAQLVRQRDALRSAWLWYVAPLVPGLVLFRWGVETELPEGGPFARGWVINAGLALGLVAVAVVNRLVSGHLGRQIDALDADTDAD